MDQVKFVPKQTISLQNFKGCLPQILIDFEYFAPFVYTAVKILVVVKTKSMIFIITVIPIMFSKFRFASLHLIRVRRVC